MDIVSLFLGASEGRSIVSYEAYIRIALYLDGFGYYRKNKARVGKSNETDFYTSVSLGGIYSNLIVESAQKLLGENYCERATFVEIAAEPETHLLANIAHPFRNVKVVRYGENVEIPSDSVVFSNEWLDAQPFCRFKFYKKRGWVELGVDVSTYPFREVELDEFSVNAESFKGDLPTDALDEYCLDISLDAEVQLSRLAGGSWSGLFLTADYGKDWLDLIQNYPEGTGRTYDKHKVDGDLLDQPGSKDITCHVCWDRLQAILEINEFSSTGLDRQESFFMKYASEYIQKVISGSNASKESDKRKLMELIHPSMMGNAFQILWGIKE